MHVAWRQDVKAGCIQYLHILFYTLQKFAVAANSVLLEVQGSALPSYETQVCVVDCCNRFAECLGASPVTITLTVSFFA